LATAVQVTVPSAARPIAPPTCWPVFSRLDDLTGAPETLEAPVKPS
jgi:hypothetical protein